MGLLLKPYLGCNLKCKYCYEHPIRKKKNPEMKYDMDALLGRIREYSEKEPTMSLHGGEILMLPNKDIERLLAEIYKYKKETSIQTNATLIDDKKIELFKKYNTTVGISWDGPDDLSDFRPGTKKVEKVIEKLLKEGISIGLIIVVSKANTGTKEKREKLKKFLLYLKEKKINIRFNPCYSSPGLELSEKEGKEVYMEFADFCVKNEIKCSPFIDIIDRLKGKVAVCFFMGCDMFCTETAVSVMGDGSLTNCMRTNKKYILLRDKEKKDVRSEVLANTPQEHGGCQGCKYIDLCRGGCPTSAIADDWRNRTSWCATWYVLFEYFEKVMSFIGQKADFSEAEKGRHFVNRKDYSDEYSDHFDQIFEE
jgi:uncharacterized protein